MISIAKMGVWGASCVLVVSTVFAAPEYQWTADRVVDGDTIIVKERFYPSEMGKIHVRVRGIDTPEKGGMAKCEDEKALGVEAARFLSKRIKDGDTLTITNISRDKYGGRIVADVVHDGISIADVMVNHGYAVKYSGRGTKNNWCGV